MELFTKFLLLLATHNDSSSESKEGSLRGWDDNVGHLIGSGNRLYCSSAYSSDVYLTWDKFRIVAISPRCSA